MEGFIFSAGGLSSFTGDLASSVELSFTMSLSGGLTENLEFPDDSFTLEGNESSSFDISTSGDWEDDLPANLESSDNASREFVLFGVDDRTGELGDRTGEFGEESCESGAALSTSNLISADFFLKGKPADCWQLAFRGIETVSGGEGLIGEFHLLSCSGVVGAERLIRELGKEASLERERGRLSVQAKGDIGRTRGRGVLLGGDTSPLGGGIFWS